MLISIESILRKSDADVKRKESLYRKIRNYITEVMSGRQQPYLIGVRTSPPARWSGEDSLSGTRKILKTILPKSHSMDFSLEKG